MSRKKRTGPGGGSGGGGAPIEVAKSRAIDVLSECFAQDLLDVEDFERRADLVHRAEAAADLEEALRGLPLPGSSAVAAPVSVPAAAQGDQSVSVPAAASARPPDVPPHDEAVPMPSRVPAPGRIRDQDRSVAVFGDTKRQGRWVPARRTTLVSFMGTQVVDLREALMAPGDYAIHSVGVFGSVEVIVPPGMDVECNGSAVFGSFEQSDPVQASGLVGGPVVRVDGFAVFGSVDVIARYPGESKRDARRRKRVEKKQRRAEKKQRRRLKAGK